MGKTKRINFNRKQIVNGVLVSALDVHHRDGWVFITPVNERSRAIESREIRMPVEDLGELVQSLEVILEEVEG